MKKIIRLTESDLTRIVKWVINEESEESKEFVVTNNTSVDELESYLNQKTEDYYSYGSENTLIEIVNNLVRNSLLSSGKSEEESESMADDFTERRMDSYSTDIEDKYDSYGRRTEGKNKFNGETIFIFDCGGDGYGFSGFFKNLTGLLEGIKKLLNNEEEDLTENDLTRIVGRVINEDEDEDTTDYMDCLDCLKKVNNRINRRELIRWFNDNDIDYYNMSDLEMYIYYIENKN